MGIFNSKQNINEILTKLDNCVDSQIQIGSVFLNYKLQEKLLGEQNEYNKKMLFWTGALVLTNICLVIATLLLLKST